jgi:hypothetical protein
MEGYEDFTVTNRDTAIDALESYIKQYFPHMPKWTPGPDPDSTSSFHYHHHQRCSATASYHEGSTSIYQISSVFRSTTLLLGIDLNGLTNLCFPLFSSLSSRLSPCSHGQE